MEYTKETLIAFKKKQDNKSDKRPDDGGGGGFGGFGVTEVCFIKFITIIVFTKIIRSIGLIIEDEFNNICHVKKYIFVTCKSTM